MLLLLRGDHGASVLFLQLFGMMVPVPLLMGFGSSWWLLLPQKLPLNTVFPMYAT